MALRRRKERERTGLVRVGGADELSVALSGGARPRALYFCRSLLRSAKQLEVLHRAQGTGAELVELSEPLFRKVADRENPDGLLATFPVVCTDLRRLRLGDQPFVVVAEALEKPGNLGAILRLADAAAADAVISASSIIDWGNPNVVHASTGAVLRVQVCDAGSGEAIGWLRERGIRIVAATPQGELTYDRADLRGPVAIAVGSERLGLSSDWLDAAAVRVRIPMFGGVDSLNVSTAAALLIYEVLRQRAGARWSG
jgi:TrmH family RNA methyltransferase